MDQEVLLAQRPVGAVDDDVLGIGLNGVPGVRDLAVGLGQVAAEAGLAGVVGDEGDPAGRGGGPVDGAVSQVSDVDYALATPLVA
jgi:hypothetical protein